MHPDRVSITTNGDGRRVIRVAGEEVPRSALWHVKAFPWPGQLEGLSPIAYARESIGLGLGAEKYGARFFGDAAIPSGVLTSDQRIDQPEADQLKARWKQAHQGKREIAVLGSGARFTAVSVSPDEAQFLGTTKANVATICRWYGVPPVMMGGETGGHEDYSSPEQRGIDFLTFTLRPWLLRVERAVSGLLSSTQRAKFNAGGFLRATLREQYEALRIGVDGRFVMPNEAREKLDLPPIDGLNRPPPDEPGASHDSDPRGSDRAGCPRRRRRPHPVRAAPAVGRRGPRARPRPHRGRDVRPGALAGTDPARIPLTARHPRDNQELPIGVGVELEERADAAWGAWRVSKTAAGDEVLELARDGVPLRLSVGFRELAGGSRWSADRRRVVRTRAELDHIAVVRTPAYVGAGVVGVRSEPEQVAGPLLLTLARLRHG